MFDSLQLEKQLCFKLYSINKALTQLYRPLLSELNLTYPQYLVMLVLWQNSQVTVSSIGEKLNLDSGTLSPLLKRLEKIGYIERQRSTSDERKVSIVLTEQGKNLASQAAAIPEKMLCKTGLSIEKYQQLSSELALFLEQLKQK